ncbi:hypothetical protein, variant [Verruconis gallopava]|uniref:Acyl-protein thioesterase 1 n=1 Tax=Verruconis gallopava TaxID=253628 RepID=A0A0D2AS98_9PEZI|nr:hypothetical protein, variant [Verruconis gallopava]KIW09405.1 hypothetical protein, variant [Verruconis gallopava]
MAGTAPLIVDAVTKHTATVIVAHGLGDSGVGWVWLAESWRRHNKFPEVKFVFPNAPVIPITLNMGFRMPGWYDITSLDELKKGEDEAGISRSQAYFHNLIDSEAKSIGSERVVFGGFSQGGAMSLYSGLTYGKKLGGIFGLSCYMLLQDKLKDKIAAAGGVNNSTPIFLGHGDADTLVRYEWGQKTADKLKEWGHPVEFHTYKDLAHGADPEEVDDLEKFLNKVIPPLGNETKASSSS